jgi:hypothetical protein
MHPPPEVNAQLAALAARLGSDYRDRFAELGGGFDVWWNRTKVGVESLFDGGRTGPMWSTSAKFAKLSLWPIGRWTLERSIADTEGDLRVAIEAFLSRGERPGIVGRQT